MTFVRGIQKTSQLGGSTNFKRAKCFKLIICGKDPYHMILGLRVQGTLRSLRCATGTTGTIRGLHRSNKKTMS